MVEFDKASFPSSPLFLLSSPSPLFPPSLFSCAKIDVHPAVFRITHRHLSSAQTCTVLVLLAPYGLAGVMTGTSYWYSSNNGPRKLTALEGAGILMTQSSSSPSNQSAVIRIDSHSSFTISVDSSLSHYSTHHPSQQQLQSILQNVARSMTELLATGIQAAQCWRPEESIRLAEHAYQDGLLLPTCLLNTLPALEKESAAADDAPCPSSSSTSSHFNLLNYMDPTTKNSCICAKPGTTNAGSELGASQGIPASTPVLPIRHRIQTTLKGAAAAQTSANANGILNMSGCMNGVLKSLGSVVGTSNLATPYSRTLSIVPPIDSPLSIASPSPPVSKYLSSYFSTPSSADQHHLSQEHGWPYSAGSPAKQQWRIISLPMSNFTTYSASILGHAAALTVSASFPAASLPTFCSYFTSAIVKPSSTPTKCSVLYIDYSNAEDGAITVNPVLSGFNFPALAVQLSLCLPFEPPAKGFIQKEMVENSFLNNIKILSDYKDGNVIAQLYDKDGFFLARVKLESWKALIPAAPPVISRPSRPPPPIQRQIRSRPLEPGFCDDVMPFHVEDLDHIYVQLVQLEVVDSCDIIQQILAEYYPTSTKLSVLPAPGSYVAAFWKEGEGLFRARVKSSDVTFSTIEAEFIEYGNTARLPLADLRVLPDGLNKYPASVNLVALGQIPHVKDAPLPPSILEFITGIVGQVCTMLVLPSPEEGPVQCMLTTSGQLLNEIITTDMLLPKRIPYSKALVPRMPLLKRVSKHTSTLEPNAKIPPLRDVPEPVSTQKLTFQEDLKRNPTPDPVVAQIPPITKGSKHVPTTEPGVQMPLLREFPQPILTPKPVVTQMAPLKESPKRNSTPEPVVVKTPPLEELPKPIPIKEPAAEMPLFREEPKPISSPVQSLQEPAARTSSIRDVIMRMSSPEPSSRMPSLREVPMRPPVPVKLVVATQTPPLLETLKPTPSLTQSLPEPDVQTLSIGVVLKRMGTPEPSAQMPSLREVPMRPSVPVKSVVGAQINPLREVRKLIPVPFQSLPEPSSQTSNNPLSVPIEPSLILSADSPQTIMLCSMEDESLFSKMEQLDELLRAYNDGPSFGHTPKVVEVCLVLSPLPVEGEEEGKLV